MIRTADLIIINKEDPRDAISNVVKIAICMKHHAGLSMADDTRLIYEFPTIEDAEAAYDEIAACLPTDPLPIPAPLYPCGIAACADNYSYPADLLHWSHTHAKWVCADCWSDNHSGEPRGISLADEMKRQRLTTTTP